MKAIIVDDEPKSIELIQSYLIHFPMIEVVATFRNGLKALTYIKESCPDLIFLDINMPHLSGLSLSRMLRSAVKIIFITAHPQHAPESYEVEAIDYLLKPVSFERFTRAIHKIIKSNSTALIPITNETLLNLKSGGNIYRINPADISILEKAANYMIYHIKGKKILVRNTAADALIELPDYFIQVHKSFIVNSKLIEYYNKEEIDVQGTKIPIGSVYRDNFIQYMQQDRKL